MDRGIAIIPKSIKPARVIENFQLFDFSLTKEDIKLLESTKHRQRLFTDDLEMRQRKHFTVLKSDTTLLKLN
ncbi:hypothetical protein COOONC_23939 [Cooperia oncophora]